MSALTTPPPAPQVPAPARRQWTLDEFYRLDDQGYFDGQRVELIHGEIIDMGKQGWAHTLAAGLAADLLRAAFAAGYWIGQPGKLRVGGSQPEPDVAVFYGSRRDYADHPDRAALLVEVADTSLAYDTTTKAELYATGGVVDYWVLDLDGRQLLVFRDPAPLPVGLGATAYRTRLTLAPGDSVSPLAAPTAPIPVADLLP